MHILTCSWKQHKKVCEVRKASSKATPASKCLGKLILCKNEQQKVSWLLEGKKGIRNRATALHIIKAH